MQSDFTEKLPKMGNTREAAKREEEILRFWKEEDIFEKTLNKPSPKGEFVFYEGPPTANGRPGIHHIEARAFKDAIPRYKTMRGFHVRRKGGWDTHGLPVELEVEKQLGLKSKKEIEKYGIAAFNKKCKESVWKYVDEWEQFTDRMGYWVDQRNPYITYNPEYMESLWSIMRRVHDRDLLYKDYKVVPWCPRCGTALSSHELAQGYEDVTDTSVYVKFRVKSGQKIGDCTTDENTYILAWTTTPWTLPGNVALAVGEDMDYVKIKYEGPVIGLPSATVAGNLLTPGTYILAKDIFWKNMEGRAGLSNELRPLLATDPKKYDKLLENVVKYLNDFDGFAKEYGIDVFQGKDLVGLEYEPLYPYLGNLLPTAQKSKAANAYKVYGADFVSTDDGTGVVHTAVMYGADDFELGTKEDLPKHHLINEDGTFVSGTDFLEGKKVRDVDTEIIENLKSQKLLLKEESVTHSYPHCWRCKTPLIYYARDSWYIRMSKVRNKLVRENKDIHWEPEHIKEGRFGEWIREVKDWAISRERYWGTPLPVWQSEDGEETLVVDSIKTLKEHTKKSDNQYFIMRHGEALYNTKSTLNAELGIENPLTDTGKKQLKEAAKKIRKIKPDIIVHSPLQRAQESAKYIAEILELKDEQLIVDERLREVRFGEFEGKTIKGYSSFFEYTHERLTKRPKGGETWNEVKRRMMETLAEYEEKHGGKIILFLSHNGPLQMIQAGARGFDVNACAVCIDDNRFDIATAEARELSFIPLPHNEEYELDLHRPFIDEVTLVSSKGTPLKRVKEVIDVWFDSGGMPFAQDHYPMENREWVEGDGYPADYICEAIDQTRGWFYTLHAIGVLMERGRAYQNVISLGHILDAKGKKMSKSVGNVVDPWEMIEQYGVDALRFWMYSVNQPGDSKNFDEKTVDEIVKKVFNLLNNSVKFYHLYSGDTAPAETESEHVLDIWIIARLHQLIADTTKALDAYRLLEPARAIREFIADFSQWYIRRSRDRFKGEGADKQHALATTRYVLLELSKIMAPFMPFLAEDVYQKVRGNEGEESVHLTTWPRIGRWGHRHDNRVIEQMKTVRNIVSLGLEARAAAGFKVRQPLAELQVSSALELQEEEHLLQLIKDEVNVKTIAFRGSFKEHEVFLVTDITDELREEGQVREIIRSLQELRKRKGLHPGDAVHMYVGANEAGKTFFSAHDSVIQKAANINKIEFTTTTEGEAVRVDDFEFCFQLQ